MKATPPARDRQIAHIRVRLGVSLIFALPLLPLLLATACEEPIPTPSVQSMPITDQTRADLKTLAGARVFFAHQSVGGNILDGLRALAKETGTPINIGPLDPAPVGPAIIEASAGQNGQPDSKIAFFGEALTKLSSQPPEIALLKLCFVDFTPQTDADALFASYQAAVAALQQKHPDMSLIHVTAPLTVRPGGTKNRVFRLIGRSVWEDDANTRRALFNHRIRATFGADALLDLAQIESTRPDGSAETFVSREGKSTAALFRGYSDDGEHLNDVGRRLAATAFARVVAAAVKNRIP